MLEINEVVNQYTAIGKILIDKITGLLFALEFKQFLFIQKARSEIVQNLCFPRSPLFKTQVTNYQPICSQKVIVYNKRPTPTHQKICVFIIIIIFLSVFHYPCDKFCARSVFKQ